MTRERFLIHEEEQRPPTGASIDEPKTVLRACNDLGERRGEWDVLVLRAVRTDAEPSSVLRLQPYPATLPEEPAFDRRDGESFDRGDIVRTCETREQR